VTVSVAIEIPIISERTTATNCPIWIISLRSILSAMAPPNRDSESMGMANPALTSPSRKGEDVIS